MAAGEATFLGPYSYSDTSSAKTALEALSNAAGDKISTYGNDKQFWVLHVQAD